MYAFIEKKKATEEQGDNGDQLHVLLNEEPTEFERVPAVQRLSLLPGERRGYWKQHPNQTFRQTIVHAAINDRRARILMDSGADVSIIDPTFAREAGIEVDTSEAMQCVGVGDAVYRTEGKTRVKITLANELAYEFSLWVGRLSGMEAILGMDFMTPAGVRLDLADGSACLPDEVRLRFDGRRQLFDAKTLFVTPRAVASLKPGETLEIRLTSRDRGKLWVTSGRGWVATARLGPGGVPRSLVITNIGNAIVAVDSQTIAGMWLSNNNIPRKPGFVSIGSRKYRDWETLAFEVTPDTRIADREATEYHRILNAMPSAVDRPSYATPSAILKRSAVSPTAAAAMDAEVTPGAAPEGIDLQLRRGKEFGEKSNDDIAREWGDPHVQIVSRTQTDPYLDAVPEESKDCTQSTVEGGDSPQRAEEVLLTWPKTLCGCDESVGVSQVSQDTSHRSQKSTVEHGTGDNPELSQGSHDMSHMLQRSTAGPSPTTTAAMRRSKIAITSDDKGRPNGNPRRKRCVLAGRLKWHAIVVKIQRRGKIEVADPPTLSTDPSESDRPQLLAVTTLDELKLDQSGMSDTIFVKEGSDLHAEELASEFAIIPESDPSDEVITETDLDVGDETINTAEEIARMRKIIWDRKHLCMGKGNALPPPAKGAVCDIDVGSARPIAQRVRKLPPETLEKVFKLLKGLLNAEIIEVSQSEWASPIVVIVKKNGIDIRLCIDYRAVNALTKLMVYPMPLVNDLLENLDAMLWFCSLDMASGFWVVKMTERAKAISAFITPFGLFQWTRMPFGLKNAPQIYQRLLDNALYGFLQLTSPESDRPDADVFAHGIPVPVSTESVIRRRSYIDDILLGASSWDDLCVLLDRLMEACDLWGLSISVPKSKFGKRRVDYLGHEIGEEGLRATPKNIDELQQLPFPSTLKGIQSFLGSLNYYNKFVEDFAIYAAALYEVTEDDIRQASQDPPRLKQAQSSFEILKRKLVEAPILRHFDPSKTITIAVYANDWAISGALLQEHDGIWMPVRFASRVLKDNELRYNILEKEVLALLRVIHVALNLVVGRSLRVITKHSTLAWLFRSKFLEGRLQQWAAILSPWDLTIEKSTKGEEELPGLLAACITPRSKVDEALEHIRPRKMTTKGRSMDPVPSLASDEVAFVISFDGSAKPKRSGGSFGAILWKAPEWEVIDAYSEFFEDATVNEAEYRGVIGAIKLAVQHEVRDVIICGDSRIVIQQLTGDIECHASGLKLLWSEATRDLRKFDSVRLVHVKREYNAAADLITGRAIQRHQGERVKTEDYGDLMTLNRLPEVLTRDPVTIAAERVQVFATTRARSADLTSLLSGLTQIRVDRLRQSQNEERWIVNLKNFVKGEVGSLSTREAEDCSKIVADYDVSPEDLLYFISKHRRREGDDRATRFRLVIPTTLQHEILHHYHTSMAGGHQGISRTYERVKEYCHWRNMHRSVAEYVGMCTDCESGKGEPRNRGRSPGNISAMYPFQVIGMDHIPSLPKSHRGNTELLIWVDQHSGYVVVSANPSRSADVIAASYERCVYRRFGASEVIRHDREPGFMSDVFKQFNKLIGQQSKATLAYRPQANGMTERMVQTITRAIKMYVQDENQRDWDEHAERIVFALNTAYDRTREETPFYLIHGWDPKTTLETMIPVGDPGARSSDARRWRNQIQRGYTHARAAANRLMSEAMDQRARRNNDRVDEMAENVPIGSHVWLYINRVKPGYAKKLAHLWHGPFRVIEKVGEFMLKLEIRGTEYGFHPLVHVSRVKLRREYPDRPAIELTLPETERFDFDEALLPEDSWIPDESTGEYEVERILDHKLTKITRFGRGTRHFHVKWKGYADPTWVPEADLSCGALIYEYEQRLKSRRRFHAMEIEFEDRDPEGRAIRAISKRERSLSL